MTDDLADLLSQLDDKVAPPPDPDCTDCQEATDTATDTVATNIPQIIGPTEIKVPDKQVDVTRFFERYEAISNELFAACRADRQEAQDAIDLCRAEIQKVTTTNGNPRDIPRMFVDGYIKAIEVKAGVNQTAVKMLDAGAKLIAAAKSHINVQQTNVNVNQSGDAKLDEILMQELDSDGNDKW